MKFPCVRYFQHKSLSWDKGLVKVVGEDKGLSLGNTVWFKIICDNGTEGLALKEELKVPRCPATGRFHALPVERFDAFVAINKAGK